ncbi:hypothetical protein ACFW04_007439 [Cataglyphis niger]
MGTVYILSAKLCMLQTEITDKSEVAYQRIAWKALKKSIHRHINKINTNNIRIRTLIQAQAASPIFTPVYAALTTVNSKFPNIGELILTQLVLQFKCEFKRNDKLLCISSDYYFRNFDVIGFYFMLLEIPTDDSVEVAIAFLKECGRMDLRIMKSFLRNWILWKRKIKSHLIRLDDKMGTQDILNVFKFDATYLASKTTNKSDSSLTNNIFDTPPIHSSLDFEECAHKLMKMQLKPGQELKLCHMFLNCCAEMQTTYVTLFEQIFKDSYHIIYRLDTNKLQNVSKFFAHLLFTDSISRSVLSCIKLNEQNITSSNRIFIKILFQQLSKYMSQRKNTRFAINFFTSVGLNSLTDDLKEYLKSRSKPTTIPALSEQHKK